MKQEIRAELEKNRIALEDNETNSKKWMELAVDTFNFACYAKHHYENGSIEEKKTILMGLSSNLLIKDKKVSISLPKHLELINTANQKIQELGIKFEPRFFGLDNKKTSSPEPVFSFLHAIAIEVRTFFINNSDIYTKYLPHPLTHYIIKKETYY